MSAGWLRQNDQDALTAIAAADTLWGQVQQLRALQLIIIVALPVVLAMAAQRWPALALLAAYVGLTMLLLDVACVSWFIIQRRREAAQTQDRFDALSFSLVRSKARMAKDADTARLAELARAQSPARAVRNRDWYTPTLESLQSAFGRLACMRESAIWDSTLRRRWSNAVMGITVFVFGSFVTWAVFSHQAVDFFLKAIAVPLSPAIVWAVREFREQRDSADAIASIHSRLRETWEQAINCTIVEPELTSDVVEILVEFLQYRTNTSPVPHSVYGLLRDRQATSATETAALLLRDYERRVIA